MSMIININNINNFFRKRKAYAKNIFLILFIFSILLALNYKLNKEKDNFRFFGLYPLYKAENVKLNTKYSELNNIINKKNKDSELKVNYNNFSYEKFIPLFLISLIQIYKTYIPKRIIIYLLFIFYSNRFCFCSRIRTGLYGGSFNPIHNGHIALARQILDAGLMDEVWFVVSPLNPFKKEKSDLLSDELRLEMTALALEEEPNMMAQDFEFHLPKPSFTWQTLQEMSKAYLDREFILIIGADNWELFHLWYNYQEIINQYSLVVYPREGIEIDEDSLPENVKIINAQLYPISSTQVRQNIKEGKSVDDLIPKCIIPKALEYYKGKGE